MPRARTILASGLRTGPPPERLRTAERDLLEGRMINACFDRLRGAASRPAGAGARRDELANLAALLQMLPGGRGAPPRRAGSSLDAAGYEHGPLSIAGYELGEEIGRGGMGVVFRAVQQSTKRVVALKVMLDGAFASRAAKRRFEREVELAAALEHPHLVTVFDSGLSRGRYYLAMEYVEGERLDRYLRRRAASTRDTLALLAKICDAVSFAHQKGVIHRDLKPSNILVDAGGEPRILDFGLAKTTGDRLATGLPNEELSLTGQVIGTVAYLSPEQAEGRLRDVDTRSDVYGLGVVLYQALTRCMPYDTSGPLAEALRRIAEDEPPPPSRLDARIDGDVSAIVLKALAKSKEARYQSVAELAADIRRYLRGECVQARSASGLYVWRKAIRRYRTQCVVGSALLLVLTLFSAIVSTLYVRVRTESRERAAALHEAETLSGELSRQSQQLQAELHQSNVRRGVAHLVGNEPFQAEGILWREYLRQADSLSTWALRSYYQRNPVAAAHYGTGWNYALRYLPNGKYLAAGTKSGLLYVWDAKQWQRVAELRGHTGAVYALDVSPDGQWLASGGADGTVRVWSTSDWQPVALLTGHAGDVNAVSFSPDGRWLASGAGDGTLRIWRPAGQEPRVRTIPAHAGGVEAVRFSPDGQRIATGGRDGAFTLWEAASGTVIRTVQTGAPRVLSLCFSPDGEKLAVGAGNSVALFDVRSAQRLWRRAAHVRWTLCLSFSADGRRLASGGWGAAIHIWDVATGERCDTLRGNPNAVWGIAFSPTDQVLAAGCIGEIRLWDVTRGLKPRGRRPAGVGKRLAVAWDDRGGQLISAGWSDGQLRFQRGATVERQPASDSLCDVAIGPDGATFATGDGDGNVTLYERASRRRLASVNTGQGGVARVRYFPRARRLATAGADGTLALFELPTLTELARWAAHEGRVLTVAVSPDGRWLLSGGTDWMARLWYLGGAGGASAAREVAAWRHKEWVTCAAFSPDSRLVATGSADCTIAVRELKSGVMHALPLEHAHWVNAVCFAPDGRFLFSGSHDRTIRVWDLRRFIPVATLPSAAGAVYSIDVSANGRTLAVGADGGTAQIDLAATTDRIKSNREYALARYAPR